MNPVFHTDDPRPGPSARPTSPSATEGHDDGTTGHPSAADPATSGGTADAVRNVPATAPVDKSGWLYCRGCNSFKPPEGRKGFRCSDCATKAKNSTSRWKFDAAGNVISKGQPAKKPLYDSEGNLIKRNAK